MAKNKGKTPAGGAKTGATGKKTSQSGAKPASKSTRPAASKKPAAKPAPKPAVKKPAPGRQESHRQIERASLTLRRRDDAVRPAMSALDYACLAAGAALAAYGVYVFAGIEFAHKNAHGYLIGVLAFMGGVLLACLGGPAVRNFLVPARDPMDNYEVVTPGSESRARQAAAITATQKPMETEQLSSARSEQTCINEQSEVVNKDQLIEDSHDENLVEADNESMDSDVNQF